MTLCRSHVPVETEYIKSCPTRSAILFAYALQLQTYRQIIQIGNDHDPPLLLLHFNGRAWLKWPGSICGALIPVLTNKKYLPIVDKKCALDRLGRSNRARPTRRVLTDRRTVGRYQVHYHPASGSINILVLIMNFNILSHQKVPGKKCALSK